jgi:hypothetical protein
MNALKKMLLAAAFTLAGPATAQINFSVRIGPPPAEYIATTPPVYYEGRPCYYYDGYWRYRDDRGAWRYYTQEPQTLYQRRSREPQRHVYYENRSFQRRDSGADRDRRGRDDRDHHDDRDRRDVPQVEHRR